MDPLFWRVGPIIELKRPSLSIEPQVHVRKLKPRDLFLIFASDGLWEHLSDDAAVQIIFKNQRNGRLIVINISNIGSFHRVWMICWTYETTLRLCEIICAGYRKPISASCLEGSHKEERGQCTWSEDDKAPLRRRHQHRRGMSSTPPGALSDKGRGAATTPVTLPWRCYGRHHHNHIDGPSPRWKYSLISHFC